MARSRQIPALAPWRPSLSEASGPIYLAIADALAADVQAGRLAAGRQLPTQRSLAAALSVDLTTITRAYNEAQARGLIEARVGQGTFVKALSELPTRRPDLSMNLPPMFDDPPLAARLWREVAQVESLGGLPLLLSYQDASGAADDKLAATRWLRPRMPNLATERVVIAAGAQAAMLAIFTLICQRGDVVCAEALSFPRFRSLASLLGLQVIAVEMDQDGLLPDAFEAVCRRAAPKALYCTPTLHNPTTATLPADRRAALAGIARRYGVHIVEDDAYGPLKPDAPAPLATLAPELTYYIGGLAKVMSPALRVAHVVAPSARDAQRLGAIQSATIGMASPLTAMVATRWIETGVGLALLEAIRSETRARFASVRRYLPRDCYAADPDAFHLWLRLPRGWSRGLFAGRLLANGIAVVPSDSFCVAGEPPEAVRLSVGAHSTRDHLNASLEQIAELLARDPDWDLSAI
jgi:DNA-binding transcriptional MocR family regulator